MINACKLRNFLSKKPRIKVWIQINAILAHDLKKLQEDVKKQKKLENEQLEDNGLEKLIWKRLTGTIKLANDYRIYSNDFIHRDIKKNFHKLDFLLQDI